MVSRRELTSAVGARLKAWIRPVYHAVRAAAYYPKSLRILKAYSEHYRKAREVYQSGNRSKSPVAPTLSAMLVEKTEPGRPGRILSLPERYPALVDRVHASIQKRLSRTENCLFFPKVDSSTLTDRLEDLPAVRNGEVVAVQLRDYRGIEGLEDLCRAVLPQIEHEVYGSHVIVDKVYIYRNLPSHVPDQVSWTWHYDNHPSQIRKVMIYLTEVTEDTGPFEYLRASGTGKPMYQSPRPLSGYGRISFDEIKQHLATGYEFHKVVGPRGTLVFFEENVVHKANVPKRGYRDAVFFQIRPATFRPDSYINPRWTGSFQHTDFNPNPYEYQPRPKPHMLSA